MIKIVVMCGGRGKRMGEMTKKTPKPLTEINGKVVLGLKIDQYINQGYIDFIFCIGYKGEMIKKYIKKYYSHINFEFSDSGINAGILLRLYNTSSLLSEKILLTYGDTIAKIQIDNLLNTHDRLKNAATITLADIQNPFGIVEFNNQNKVTYFKEKPIFNYYIGYAIINKKALLSLPKSMIEAPDGKGLINFFQSLIDTHQLGAYKYDGLQLTFNTSEEYNIAKDKIHSFYTYQERVSNEK